MLDVKSLGGMTNLKLIREGTALVQENKANPELMYIILNGTVEAIKGYGTENSSVVDTLVAGRIFGEQCLFAKDLTVNTSYVCKTPISTIVISPEYFSEILQNKPHIVLALLAEICKELAEAKERRPARKSAVKVEASDNTLSLFPAPHKGYPTPQPESFYEFLLQADKTCPYCKTVFNTDQIYNSKLKLKTPAGIDMRKYYTGFEPCWYNVITCPNCYFSSFDDYFEREELIYKSPEIIKKLEEVKKTYIIDFEEERNLDFVFISYYIALICAKAYDNEMQISSKLWLELTYLYSDTDDREMYLYSVKKAKEVFNHFYGSVNMKAESEQYCCLLLAHFSIELGDEKEAIMFLNNVRTNKDGIAVYKTMAENKYYDIREAKKFEESTKK